MPNSFISYVNTQNVNHLDLQFIVNLSDILSIMKFILAMNITLKIISYNKYYNLGGVGPVLDLGWASGGCYTPGGETGHLIDRRLQI